MYHVIVGKLLQEPVQLPDPTKIVQSKQYRMPGGHEEITQTIKEYVKSGVMIPVTTERNNPAWPGRKLAGSWRMAVGYREFYKVTPPLEAAVSTRERHQWDSEKPSQ